MGEFAQTCAISGLPIEGGDEIRYILLTENPYNKYVFKMTDLYFPRSIPIKGIYNDYGNIEEETGVALKIIPETFKLDLIETGWGDNLCHDVPVNKDLSFQAFKNALQENRVFVKYEFNDDNDDKEDYFKYKIPLGVPTRKRIEKEIINAGFTLYQGEFGKGICVRKISYGKIKVTSEDYSKEKQNLNKIKKILDKKYATVLVAAKASLSGADLLVMAKPETKGFHGYYENKTKKKKLNVRPAMIREDVWQALLQRKISLNYGKPEVGIGECYKLAEKFFKDSKKQLADFKKSDFEYIKLNSLLGYLDKGFDNPITFTYAKDAIPYRVGLGTNWRIALEMYDAGKLTKEEIKLLLKDMAELAFVQSVLMDMRYYWRPSYACGPQFGAWEVQEEIYKTFSDIAKNVKEEQEKMYQTLGLDE